MRGAHLESVSKEGGLLIFFVEVPIRDTWLAQLEEHTTLDLRMVSSRLLKNKTFKKNILSTITGSK